MEKKIMMAIAAVLLVICLLSGGCAGTDDNKISAWRDMLKIPVDDTQTKTDNQTGQEVKKDNPSTDANIEKVNVKLYFADSQSGKLGIESRNINKVQGIARETLEELFKGPSQSGFVSVVPAGTRLLDINLKPDGVCVVDLSPEAGQVKNAQQEKLMLYAIADTLGQFPAVKEVDFMLGGEEVRSIGGYINLDQPLHPDYSLLQEEK